MIVKKYKAPTETEAILLAKQELGSTAVVLNVKTIEQRGIMKLFKKDAVEITAALEEKEYSQSTDEKKSFQNTLDLVTDDTNSLPPNAIEEKLNSLHNLLQEQMDTNRGRKSDYIEKESSKESSRQAVNETVLTENDKYMKLIYNSLISSEVDEKYVNMIMEEIEGSIKKESTLDNIISNVYQKIVLKLDEPEPIDIGDKTKVVFFMGPTGVGKTTTIAKLASKFKLNDNKNVAFVTADTYRIAAVEQLNTYANILDIPIKVIYTPSELKPALNNFKAKDIIFVDTAGRSHKDEKQREELEELFSVVNTDKFEVEKILCTSLTTKYKDLLSITDAFKNVDDYKLLFTKLDETDCLGNILNIKLRTNAPLSYATIGQKVPDDIEVINVQKIAKQLLGGNEN